MISCEKCYQFIDCGKAQKTPTKRTLNKKKKKNGRSLKKV